MITLLLTLALTQTQTSEINYNMAPSHDSQIWTEQLSKIEFLYQYNMSPSSPKEVSTSKISAISPVKRTIQAQPVRKSGRAGRAVRGIFSKRPRLLSKLGCSS